MHRYVARLLSLVAALPGSAVGAGPPAPPSDHPVLELRQYKLVTGAQDAFISLFDKEFVETQEALGMRLVGQFHDHDRPDRFTWLREFPSMAQRAGMLQAFYFGPVWQKFRGTANPMLDDNDNVLLLRPARHDSSFGPSAARGARRANSGRTNSYFAVVEYLWKDPNEGFSDFFIDRMSPLVAQAGLPVLGVYVPEEQPNNFPRLPIRPDRKILVWFTKAADPRDFAAIRAKLEKSAQWRASIARALADAEERPPQVLRLDPTPRSALH
jgi:hypothetical protein